MKRVTFKIPEKYLNENVKLEKKKCFTMDNIDFSIEIEFSKSDRNIFSIRFIAEPKKLLPYEVSIEGNLLSSYSKFKKIEKQVIFDEFANSDKIFFPIKLSEIRSNVKYSSNHCLELSIGIGPPSKPTLNPNYSKPKQNTDISNKELSPSSKNDQYFNIKNNQLTSPASNEDEHKLFNKNGSNTDINKGNDNDSQQKIQKTKKDSDGDANKYNGLYNQGATCYINSAIQALYHIPLFRKTIYDIPTENEEDQTKSVPLNLQCLFYNLQCGKKTCSTIMLTTSFGWEKDEVYRQQDIEEFLKKLISILDDIMKKIPNMKDKISFLFEGKTIQTIKDYSNNVLSNNEEIFYDLSIDVKKTLEDSFKKFTKEEYISDYTDSRSPTPQLVTYQTLLLTLPRILQIQIKRYKYNVITGSAEKIDSELSYTEEIDLAPFMYKKDPTQCTKYKLFGVIVHSGIASGGHYYIYCKPEMKEDWYVFNDSWVQTVDSKEALEENFGGIDINSYLYTTKSWKKDYSAYMLIYIRIDSIVEVFKPIDTSEIPENIKTYAEKVNLIELQRRKSDPECQINFTIYTEQCVYENCKIGVASFMNQKNCFKVSADRRSEAEDLYQDIAKILNIKVECLRLWLIDNDGSSFKKIIQFNEKLSYLRVQKIFAQIKDENEDLDLGVNYLTFFLILYTPLRAKPFSFIQMQNYKTKQYVSKYGYNSVHLKYESIIEDATKILRKNLSSKINKDNVGIYIINSNNVEQKDEFGICREPNGSMMIIQIDDKDLLLDDTNIKDMEKKINIKGKFKKITSGNNNNLNESQETTHKYFDYMTNSLPSTVDKYFKLRNFTMKPKVFNFSNILHSIGTIEIPNLKPNKLEQFISLAFDININEKQKDTLLLFNKEENLNVPKPKPFNSKYSTTTNEKLDNIYFCITSKKDAEDYSSETRIIQLSKDALTISKVVCYFMPDRDVHPFGQFKMLNEDFFGEKTPTRMFVVDENNNFGPPITDEYHETHFKLNNKNKLRIEIIPEDQIDKDLMLVYKGYVGEYSKIQLIEEPFYFAYIPDEPVSSFKSRISKFLGIKKEFKVHKKSNTYYFDSYVMKDKIKFDSYNKEKVLFILFDIESTE
ncbi:hypothetical protein M9Y10_041330 [Tritrichomonas musculus]|uniref:USP domain-containing protein n=1 Tax=Tritrichomonas musculus TaxID=1915356 RepID=A0ABR2K4Y3_9EUKA